MYYLHKIWSIRVETIGKFTTSLESKRKKLEPHSGTFSPVETRKTFAFEEIVTDSKHFYIDPSETNAKILIPRILHGENLAIVSPYQTGKTTMARKLALQLRNLGLLPLLVDIRSVIHQMIASKQDFWTCFLHILKRENSYLSGLDLTDTKNVRNLFSKSNSKFVNQQIVLLVDEIDSFEVEIVKRMIKDCPIEEQREIVHEVVNGNLCLLSDLLSIRNNHSTYETHSVVFFANWMGQYMDKVIGNSPFRITQVSAIPTFTFKEVKELLGQWATQEKVKIDPSIVEFIFEYSNGVQGMVGLLASYYVNHLRQFTLSSFGREPTMQDFENQFISTEFWNFFLQHVNVERIVALFEKNTNLKREVFRYMLDQRNELSVSTKNVLMKLNIIKPWKSFSPEIEFTSPLMERVVYFMLEKQSITPMETIPLTTQGSIDFVSIVANVVKQMNRFAALSHTSSKPYQYEFERVLISMLNTSSVLMNHTRYFSIDDLERDHGGLIPSDGSHEVSMQHHVQFPLQTKEGQEKFFIIHWMSTPRDHQLPFQRKDILYIYHDKNFENISIFFNHTRMDIVNELPPLKD